MQSFANTLLEVDSAGTAATVRHRRERANGIVKPWTSSPHHRPHRGHPVGGLQLDHPNTLTTSRPSAAVETPMTPVPPAPCGP